MLKIITALALLTLTTSLSTYTYGFPTTLSSPYQSPSYPLGQLTQDTQISIVIQIPFGGAILIGSYVVISIMDSSNTITIVSFDDSNPMNCNGGTTCTLVWRVIASNTYNLKVSSTSPNTELNNLVLYYLSVSTSTSSILRVVDVLRQHMIKYFYIGQSGTTVSFTITPQIDPSTSFSLLTMTPSSSSNFNVLRAIPLYPTTTANSVSTFTRLMDIGYYAIIVYVGSPTQVTITFQSDPYPCPYTNGFNDYYTIFTGCTRSSVISINSGLPCITFDYNSQVCLACMNGYSVLQGSCVISTSCGPRQYYKFGSCYLVSSTCDQYNPYTGDCLTCINYNSISYQLINGQCIISTNFCNSSYHLVNSICVSNTCGAFNQQTGACINCVTAAYYLSSGKCLPVDCGNSSYYSVKISNCTILPTLCSNFSIIYEICYNCIPGTNLINGVCTQYSNTLNCQLYNFAANVCNLCYVGYYLLNGGCILAPACPIGQQLVNGICVLNPITCNQSQVILNGQCITMPNNCLNMNAYYQCTQCSPNFQVINGNCYACLGANPNFPCTTCQTNQYVDNKGICQTVSIYCATYSNQNGFCLTCKNGLYPVNGICCDFGQIYQYGVCVQIPTPVDQNNISGGDSNSSGSSSNSGNDSTTSSTTGSVGTSSSSLRQMYGIYCAKIDPQRKVCTACLSGRSFRQGVCM